MWIGCSPRILGARTAADPGWGQAAACSSTSAEAVNKGRERSTAINGLHRNGMGVLNLFFIMLHQAGSNVYA